MFFKHLAKVKNGEVPFVRGSCLVRYSFVYGFVIFVKFSALGNGTKSKEFYVYLKNKISCEIKLVDEKNTTLEARKLYWKIHKPDLFERLLPEGLRVPKRNLDDLAAFAIALRALQNIEI